MLDLYKSGRNYATWLFNIMVIFGPLVFYLLGPPVIFSALWFSIYSGLRIRPTGQVRNEIIAYS